jgi:S1-C subfamily serine protease
MVAFEVFQPLEDGSLCISLDSQREIFLWIDLSKRVAATDERYSARLYWAGTFSYTTAQNRERTVNVYAMDLENAISAVRMKFGMFDKTEKPHRPEIAEQGGQESTIPKGFGSGFIITADGYVVTCQHVINSSRRLRVKTVTGVVDAKLVAQDKENDLALLKIEGSYEPVSFAAASSAKLGQTIFTLGFPMPDLQGFEPKVTKGVISSLSGISDDIRHYQIDAAIQSGNSGGPLADEAGNIVGILDLTLNPGYVLQETGNLPQNVNYAVRKSYLMAFLEARREVVGRLSIAAEGVKPAFEDAVEKMRKSVVLIVAY